MSSPPHAIPKSITDRFEENMIALILGLMTLITFANVIARYVFNNNILWALEATVFLFAWLVLLGASYGVKTTSHLGVDLLVQMAPPKLRKLMSLAAVALCLVFCGLLLKGACDYWWKFATTASFLTTEDIRVSDSMQPAFEWFGQLMHKAQMVGIPADEQWEFEFEPYEKLPLFVPYLALPVGMALLTLRFAVCGWQIIRNQRDMLISSHEVEDELEELSHERNRADETPEARDAAGIPAANTTGKEG